MKTQSPTQWNMRAESDFFRWLYTYRHWPIERIAETFNRSSQTVHARLNTTLGFMARPRGPRPDVSIEQRQTRHRLETPGTSARVGKVVAFFPGPNRENDALAWAFHTITTTN